MPALFFFILLLLSEPMHAQYSNLGQRTRFTLPWAQVLDEGIQLLQTKKFNPAEQFFRSYLAQQDPPFAYEARFQRAIALLLGGNSSRASSLLRTLSNEDRTRFLQLGGAYWLGWWLVDTRQFFAAVDPLEQQLTLSGKARHLDYSNEARYLLAAVALKLNTPEQALEHLDQVRGPLALQMGLQHGLLLLRTGRYLDAYRAFSGYLSQLEVVGQKAEATFLQGESAFQADDLLASRRAFDAFLRLSPEGALAAAARARLIQLQNRKDAQAQPPRGWEDINISSLHRRIARNQLPKGKGWDALFDEVSLFAALADQDLALAIQLLEQQESRLPSNVRRLTLRFNRALLLLKVDFPKGLALMEQLAQSPVSSLAQQALFQQARALVSRSGQQQRGLALFGQFFDRYPRSEQRFEAYRILFDAYQLQPQSFAPAMSELASRLEKDPELPVSTLAAYLLQTGEAYRVSGKQERALGYYARVLSLQAGSAVGFEAGYRIAHIYAERNEYTRALTLTKELLQQRPPKKILYQGTLLAADLLLALQRQTEALIYLDTLVELADNEQDQQQARLQKGIALYRLNRNQEAVDIFTGITQFRSQLEPPVEGLALFWRGATYFRMGNFQRSLRDFKSVARTFPQINRAQALYRAAFSAESGGDYPQAIGLLEEGMPLLENNTELYNEAATRLLKLQLLANRIPQARVAGERFLRQDKGERIVSQAFHQAAEFLFNQGEVDRSLLVLQQRKALFPQLPLSGESLYLEASLQLQLGGYADAALLLIAYLKSSADGTFAQSAALTLAQLVRQGSAELSNTIREKLAPPIPRSLRDIVSVAWLSRQPPSAEKIKQLEQLYTSTLPTDARSEVIYQLGKTYLALGRETEGQSMLAKLQQADPFWRGAGLMEQAAYLQTLGKVNEAVPLYQQIVDQYSTFPELVAEALYRLAGIASWLGDDGQAARYRQRLQTEHRGSRWAREP